MLDKIYQYQTLIIQGFFLLSFIFWYPFFDPSISKLVPLVFLPLLFYKKKKVPSLLILSILLFLSLFFISKYHTIYVFYEAIFLIFLYLGVNYSQIKLHQSILCTTLLALLFFLCQKFQLLPFVWQQAIVLLNHEFLDSSFTFPSFFGNPSPMCLFFVLASLSIKEQKTKIKILFLVLCAPMILLSDSTIGIFFYFVTCLYLFVNKEQIKYLVSFAILLALSTYFFYPNLINRPFQTRSPLYQLALKNTTLLGHGPGTYHLHSGQLKGENTTQYHLSRNQFHPHNDLLFYLYSYGFLGLLLRLTLYASVLYLSYFNFHLFPLIFYLLQIQFTPDALSFPAAPLFFFFLGQELEKIRSFQKSNPLNSFYYQFVLYALCLFFLYQVFVYHQEFYKVLNSKTLSSNAQKHRFSSPAYQYNLAVYYMKKNSMKKAQLILKELQGHSPHFQDIDYLFAHIYYAQKEVLLAKSSLENKLKIDAYHVYTYLFLADILIELQDKNRAIQLLKKGLLCLPNDKLLNNRLSSLE
ncbi:hypothetical protein MJH12_03640 [bacterium]|nr:hypothetical protein [bacterium]